jgi:D-methionine transport system ATP-binding protein
MRVIRDICDRVLVLEGGRVAEQGPVWQVFGEPRHVATHALLRPLEADLPEDLALRLQPAPPLRGSFEQLVELRYTGNDAQRGAVAGAPDLARVASALGGRVRLLHAGLERIQGRTQGRLLVAVPGSAALPAPASSAHPESPLPQTKVLGYVPAND